MGIPELTETIKENEIFCDDCGRSMGFIKWFSDMTTPCLTCRTKQTPQEAAMTHKMLCNYCRILDT